MSDLLSPSSSTARRLLDEGFSFNGEELSKNEALRWAAVSGFADLVRLLIKEGADLNALDEDGRAAVHQAAWRGSCEIMSILSEENANILMKDNRGNTPLHYAAAYGHCDMITLLVTTLGVDLQSRDNKLSTPLHAAAECGQCKAIQLLHDMKADINCRNKADYAPVHLAAGHGNLEALQLLIQLGSDITLPGQTLGLLAAESSNPEILDYLGDTARHLLMEADANGVTPLTIAVSHDDREAVEVLLRHNVAVDQKDKAGYSAVAIAALWGHTEILRLLVNHNATLNTMDAYGNWPMHHAAFEEHTETMQYLLENGADIEVRNYGSWTPLHVASHMGNCLAARFLVDHGAHIDAKINIGATALSIAASWGYDSMVSLLLHNNANIATQDNNLWTPLHIAAHSGHQDVVESLLDNGADPTAETIDGNTAHFLAARQEHTTIVNLLGQSAIYIATDEGHRLGPNVLIEDSEDLTRETARYIHKMNAANSNGQTPSSIASQKELEDMDKRLLQIGDSLNSPISYRKKAKLFRAVGHHRILDLAKRERAASISQYESLISHFPDISDTASDEDAEIFSHPDEADYGLDFESADSDEDAGKFSHPDDANYGAASESADSESTIPLDGRANVTGPMKIFHPDELVDVVFFRDTTRMDDDDGDDDHENIPNPLQSQGALLDPPDGIKYQPFNLIRAASIGLLAEMRRLIRVGANVNGTDDGLGSPVYWAAFSGQDAAIGMLIKHGALVDAQAEHGDTALSAAATWGHTSTIKLLHQEGAELDAQDKFGLTPLSSASKYGKQEAVKALLELGADKEKEDQQSRTPLFLAASSGHVAVVDILLENGANIESADAFGYTPLAEAVLMDSYPIVERLLEMGARMTPESVNRCSPLGIAAAFASKSLIELLIGHGADLNHPSDHGATPVIIAAKMGNATAAKTLVEMGADVHIKDNDGSTALSYAQKLGYRKEPFVDILTQATTLLQTRTQAKAKQDRLNQRMKYEYRPLEEGYIRVLELNPGREGDIISFELYDVSLGSSHPFDALSYEWKGKFGTIPVQCGADRLLVTPNCKSALDRIRHETERRSLWIDAVCINQEDKQECNHQVAMMTDIYRKARSVLMWIGEGDENTQAAFDQLWKLDHVHNALRNDADPNSWDHVTYEEREHEDPEGMVPVLIRDFKDHQMAIDGLRSLISSEYFKRAWIFQEIILAGTRGVVMCGQDQCSWEEFKGALLGLTCLEDICPPQADIWAFAQIVRCDAEFRKHGHLDLMGATVAMTWLKASDPRDKIFAALRLSSVESASVKRPVADYTLTAQEVYVNASRYFIDVYGDVFVWNLKRPCGAKRSSDLPSWAVDFAPLGEDRTDADPFRDERPNYGKFINGRASTTAAILRVYGCLVDKVSFNVSITKEMDAYGIVKPAVQALATHGRSVYDSYIDYSPRHKTKKKRADRRDDTRRTTNGHAILDTVLRSTSFPGYDYGRVAAFLAWNISADGDVPACSRRAPHFLRHLVADWERRSEIHDDFDLDICRNMEYAMRYGRDLVYTENGYFGLTSKGEAEEGLWVAVVGGSDDLVLLREKMTGEDTWYEYVDRVFLNHYDAKIEKLEDLRGNTTIQRLEIR